MKKRILSMLICLLLLVQLIPAAAAGEKGGQFAFAAMTNTAVVIQPTYISYAPGQTVMEALQASDYTFEGSSSFINVINGVEASYSRYADDGDYNLNRPASQISGFVFTGGNVELQNSVAGDFCEMVTAMADFNLSENGVKSYPEARSTYDAANSALFSAAANHKMLAEALRTAMTVYEQTVLNGQKHALELSFATMSGAALQEYQFTVSDLYESVSFGPADTIMLRAGTYAFTLENGNNSAFGTMTVTETGQVQIGDALLHTICIPEQRWIGDIELRRSSGGQNFEYADGAYWIPDCCETVYIGIGNTQNTPAEAGSYVTYTKANGEAVNSKSKPWNSSNAALAGVLDKSSVPNTVRVEAKCPYDGYTMMQTVQLRLNRTPTLRALTVSANGVAQNIGFDPMITEYTLAVSSDFIELTPEAFEKNSASVSVDGKELQYGSNRRIELADTKTTVSVSVDSGEAETTYTLLVTKSAAKNITLLHDADVSVRVFNSADAEIGATEATGSSDTFALVPGQSYRYVAEKNGCFFAEESFGTDVSTVRAKTPHTENKLNKLAVGSAQNTKYADFYLNESAFSAQTHTYKIQVADPYPAIYVWAAGEAALSAIGPMGKTAIFSGNTTGQQVKIKASDETQTVTIRVSEADETYYQDYQIGINRVLTLTGLQAKIDGKETKLFQVDDGRVTNVPYFDEEITEYQANIVRASKEAELTIAPFGSDYYVVINGKRYDLPENENGETATALTATISLSNSMDKETVPVQVCSNADGAVFQTYNVTFEKNDAVATRIIGVCNDTSVDGALTVVHDVQSGDRIWPSADGSFPLVETVEYTYVITCYGYVGEKGTLTAGKEKNQIKVPMTKTASGGIETDITSSWPYFRGSADANGVVNVRTPIRAEDTMLSWANKLGDGYSSAAVSCPILITENGYDYLIVYAGDRIFKVDALSGTVVAVGQMDRSSSFAINSPTYAEGMIFVGLSNGGVQAFRADTLQSIWLYNDEMGGQPNCPIAYHDGYVYTGFWNSETTKANFVCLSVTDEDPDRTTEEKLPTWTHTDKGFYWAGCYVTDDYLLVGTDDGDSRYVKESAALLCLNPATGAVLDSVQGLRGDVRSNVSYDSATDRFYFTSKGGYFYSVKMDTSGEAPKITDLRKIYLNNYADDPENPPMSTCTPVIYNGRAYIGVSGTGQFKQYSGHNITVIDLSTWSIAYSVRTQGYPQTSGLLTTAYQTDGFVYVYFFDNFTPGKLRALRDRPGQTAPDLFTVEEYTDKGNTAQYTTPYVLFTPSGGEAQYAICSPITDTHSGTLYFKNDSARLMALSSTIEKMEVTKQPDKLEYQQGEQFDPSGMEIQITYSNGTTRTLPARRTVNGVTIDYFTWSDEPLSAEMSDLMIGFHPVLYQNYDGEVGVPYMSPQAVVQLTITSGDAKPGDLNADGEVDMQDLSMMIWYVNEVENFTLNQGQLTAADVDGSGEVDLTDVSYMIWYLNEVITEFPVTE